MNSQKNTDYQIPKDFNSSEIMEPINNFPYASKIINENTIIKESVGSLITFNTLNSGNNGNDCKFSKEQISNYLSTIGAFEDFEIDSLAVTINVLAKKFPKLEIVLSDFDVIIKTIDIYSEINSNESENFFINLLEEKRKNKQIKFSNNNGNNEPKEQSEMDKEKQKNIFEQAIAYLNIIRPNNENNSKLANYISNYAKENSLSGEKIGDILNDYMNNKVLSPIKIFLNNILDDLGEKLSNKFYSFLEKKGHFGVIENKILEKEFNNFVDSLIKKYEEDSFGKTIIKKS